MCTTFVSGVKDQFISVHQKIMCSNSVAQPMSLPFEIAMYFNLIAVYLNLPGARFSKAPETFRTREVMFSSSLSKNGEVCTPETSCMKGTSVHIKNM